MGGGFRQNLGQWGSPRLCKAESQRCTGVLLADKRRFCVSLWPLRWHGGSCFQRVISLLEVFVLANNPSR